MKVVIICFMISAILLLGSCGESKKKQVLPESGYITLTSKVCYFSNIDSIQKKTRIKIDTPSKREVTQINDIMAYVGLPQNFRIYRGNVENALATTVENQRLIIYNKDMFTRLDDFDTTGNYWSTMFVIAHEIGHHLAYNLSDTTNSRKAELDADVFAAATLYKMGANEDQVIAAVNSKFVSDEEDNASHPGKSKRIEVVLESWNQAALLRYRSAIPPPPIDPPGVMMWEFFEDQLYGTGVKETFAPIESYKEYRYENLEGIILEVGKWGQSEQGSDTTSIAVMVTKTTKEEDAIVSLDQKLFTRVEFQSSDSHKRFFKLFLKPGRRIKFSIVSVRVGINYLTYIKELNYSGE